MNRNYCYQTEEWRDCPFKPDGEWCTTCFKEQVMLQEKQLHTSTDNMVAVKECIEKVKNSRTAEEITEAYYWLGKEFFKQYEWRKKK